MDLREGRIEANGVDFAYLEAATDVVPARHD